MPLQNRVTPAGNIITNPARGTFMGNRGILHDDTETLGKARWKHKAWITCLLEFRGRYSEPMPKNRYTRLFFLDEAVALAVGHRPCYECRRADYNIYMDHWASAHKCPIPRAGHVDTILHSERINSKTRQQITTQMRLDALPNGAFVQLSKFTPPHLVYEDALYAFKDAVYAEPIKRPKGITVNALTPQATIWVMQSGFTPLLHPSLQPS
jgi:hypothetical protein